MSNESCSGFNVLVDGLLLSTLSLSLRAHSDLLGSIFVNAAGEHEKRGDVVNVESVSNILGFAGPVDNAVCVEHKAAEEAAVEHAWDNVVKDHGGPEETSNDGELVEALKRSASLGGSESSGE